MSDRISPTTPTSFAVGPPSPSSPLTGSQKKLFLPSVVSEQIPQTPTSPPLMSVSAQSYVSFTSSQTPPQSQAAAHSQSANLASPPSSTPMSIQASQQATTIATTNSFPTPASSISGHVVGSLLADDPEHAEKTFDIAGSMDSQSEFQDQHRYSQQHQNQKTAESRRTDHDRQLDPNGPRSATFTISPHTENAMDGDKISLTSPASVHSEIDSLQSKFSSAFHLCKSCKGTRTFTLMMLPGLSFPIVLIAFFLSFSYT